MGKRLYVDGNIVIMTPYFICPDLGAGFGIPKDAEVIKTNDIIEGSPCLVIDEDRPQSLFNEYYATGGVASGYISVSYLHNTYIDCFDEFHIEITNVEKALKDICLLSVSSLSIIYKSLYINLITILDSFLCSIILVKLIRDEELFKTYYEKHLPQHVQRNLQVYLLNDEKAKWEQKYIMEVLKGSYCNVNTIKEIFKLFDWSVPCLHQLAQHFHCRHLLVHRNGRKRDGTYINIDQPTITELIYDLKEFVNETMKSIR